MKVVSVDLAYLDYREIGVALLDGVDTATRVSFIVPRVPGTPRPGVLAEFLCELCAKHDARLLLIDGPQGWKHPDNGLLHSRICERVLNTPAKTGLPGQVKPANYAQFVQFSIDVFDELHARGITRYAGGEWAGSLAAFESFPLSAWRTLSIPILPAKKKATASDVVSRTQLLAEALDTRAAYEIRFPRVEGYTQAVRNRVTVRDWSKVPTIKIVDGEYPSFVDTQPYSIDARGASGARGPGRVHELTIESYNEGIRVQRGVFQMAAALTKSYLSQAEGTVPAHVLFPQLVPIVERFVRHHVQLPHGATLKRLFTPPFYGLAVERLVQDIVPDERAGEAPELPRLELLRPEGSTADVDYWTSKEVRDTKKSHVNYMVPDTARWEQQAAEYLQHSKGVEAYVKNAGLGFAIPYLHDGQMHDYIPDFIARLSSSGDNGSKARYLILETKGYDPLDEVKEAAAQRWCAAVNADGRWGTWRFAMARKIEDVPFLIQDGVGASEVQG